MSNINTLVTSYMNVDDEIKLITKQLTSLKTQRLTYSEQISDYIDGSNQDYVKIGEDTIKLLKYKKKVFNRQNLEESIKNNIKNEAIEKKIMEESMENREENYLKRIKK